MSCEYCRQILHHPRCPLAPESKSYGKCKFCGEEIYEGDKYIENDDGEYAHYDCPTVIELVEFLGYEVKTIKGDYE